MSDFEMVLLAVVPEAEFVKQKRFIGDMIRDGWQIVDILLVERSPLKVAVFLVGERVPNLIEPEVKADG